jgi:hypothetical protein
LAAGILLDLDAPALVIGEMPVQRVHLVKGHPVDELFHVFHGLEVTRRIQHEPAPGETGRIRDRDHGHGHAEALLWFGGRELPQCHAAIEEPGR